jgi:NAD+ kinase
VRFLVVQKSFRVLGPELEALQALERRAPERAAYHARAAEAHRRSVEQVAAALAAAGVDYSWTLAPTPDAVAEVDAVITVGGDGTLLQASHDIADLPVLGVNSAPSFSVGYFATATPDTFPAHLRSMLSGTHPVVSLTRVRVHINDQPLPRYALNEVLFAHQSPAGTSRYRLTVEGASEAQRSSGLWVSTAAGSSAAIASAGGQRMPLAARALQVLVREPCHPQGGRLRLLHAFTEAPVRIVSEALTSAVYVDGPRRPAPVEMGDEVVLDTGAPPLRLFRSADSGPSRLASRADA